jgi:predicted metal-dependent peptidase
MNLNKLTAEQRLHRSHVTLMAHKKFILMSGVLVSGNVSVVDKKDFTARTDGLNVEYGRDFVTGLTDKQLNFLVLHENWHKAYKHFLVWKPLYAENPQLANMACDYVINLQIVKYDPNGEVTEFIEGGCIDERFDGMDAQQVYNILKQEQEDGGGNGSGGSGESLDEHDWEEARSWDKEKIKEVEKQIDQALRQGEVLLKKKGEAGSGGDRSFSDLLEPKTDPYELLREFMTATCSERSDSSWRRPNRRFISQDIYMPSQFSEALEDVVIGIDTSGSIGGRELQEFLTETAHICESVHPRRVHLLYWDTEVCRHEVYEGDDAKNIAQSTKPSGGGGTDADCVANFCKRNNVTAQVCIMLTDGYVGEVRGWAGMPPTVWMICKGGNKQGALPGKKICL